MPTFDHVNLGVPEGGAEDEIAFLVDLLGFHPVDAGAEATARGARWFEGDDGGQVHLSVDIEHRPAAKAHVAVRFDDLDATGARLAAHGIAYDDMTALGVRRLLLRDPAGNRWELLAAQP